MTQTTEAAYTPGPWVYEETTLGICRLIVSIEDVQAFEVSPSAKPNHAIAYVPCDIRREEQEANARLIAAAPDLVEAAQALLTRIAEVYRPEYVERAAAAQPESFLGCAKRLHATIAKAEGR